VGEFNEAGMGELTVRARMAGGRKPRTATATEVDPRRRNLGWNKNGPRGSAQVPEKARFGHGNIVNSKQNPRIFKAIPRILQRIFPGIKGFTKDAKPYPTAKPGVKRRHRHRDPKARGNDPEERRARLMFSGSPRRQSPSEKTRVSRRPMAARDDGAVIVL
jgi:hypothetical protein